MADYGLDNIVTEIEIALSNLPTLSVDQRSAVIGQIVGGMRSLQAAVMDQAIRWQMVPKILRDVYSYPAAALTVQAIINDLANRSSDEEWEELICYHEIKDGDIIDVHIDLGRMEGQWRVVQTEDGGRAFVGLKGANFCGTDMLDVVLESFRIRTYDLVRRLVQR